MSKSILQRRHTCLVFALLVFVCGQVTAQSTSGTTAADQGFKTIPQQAKTTAELKATNKANNIANSASDKVDSGMNKAYHGLIKMFKKKPKTPAAAPRDSISNLHPTDTIPMAPKSSFVPVQQLKNKTVPRFRRKGWDNLA